MKDAPPVMKDAPLGQQSAYPDRYSSDLLYPVPREANRSRLGISGPWPWFGEDRWQAFELSWLAPTGIPRVAIGEIRVPASSPHIIESKSLKLYCNSLNQMVFGNEDAVKVLMEKDLSQVAGAAVELALSSVDQPGDLMGRPEGYALLDDLPVSVPHYRKDPALLRAIGPGGPQKFCSHLLKSNCPVTGQPDWGSLLIAMEGPAIDQPGLLQYIVGYRNTQDFHEHCVESIFMDLMQALEPAQLTVSAQYTRRGGLDINPWRSTVPGRAPGWRFARQ